MLDAYPLQLLQVWKLHCLRREIEELKSKLKQMEAAAMTLTAHSDLNQATSSSVLLASKPQMHEANPISTSPSNSGTRYSMYLCIYCNNLIMIG